MDRTVRIRIITFASAAVFFVMSGIHGYVQAAPVVLFADDFESEAATGTTFNYTAFTSWNVVNGTVDLISSGDFSIDCVGMMGWCVDLDGTTDTAGRLESKSAFALTPSVTYTLTFDISGNQRVPGTDSMTFGLTDGSTEIFSDTITKSITDPFETITRNITVTSATNAMLFFDHAGGDQFGLILDSVTLTAVPIPPAIWLLGTGLLGLIGISRRKKAT